MNAATPLARGAFSLYQSDDGAETVLAVIVVVVAVAGLYVRTRTTASDDTTKNGVGQMEATR